MDTTENEIPEIIGATVHELEYMWTENGYGERLWLLIYVGDIAWRYDPDDFERMGAILRDLPGGSYTEDRDMGSYKLQLPVSSLPELRALAERWPSLVFALNKLEKADRDAVQRARQTRWESIPDRNIRRYTEAYQIQRWEHERAERELVVRHAKRLGWRSLTFGPAMTCGGTEAAWRTFAYEGSSEMVKEVLSQLRIEIKALGRKKENAGG